MKQYLHYVPLIDQYVITERRYRSFWKDAFINGESGKTPMIFIAVGDWGFSR